MNASSSETLSLIPPRPSFEASDGHERYFKVKRLKNGEQTVVRVTGYERVMAQHAVHSYLNTNYADELYETILPTTPEKKKMEDEARLFVADEIQIPVKDVVYWQSDQTFAGHWGTRSNLMETTHIAERNVITEAGFRHMHQMSLLVHEFAHSTDTPSDLLVIAHEPDEAGDRTNDLYATPSLIIPKLTKKEGYHTLSQGSFFEEAFAEEVTAKWRESFSPLMKEYGAMLWNCGDNTLPARYFDFDYTSAGPHYPSLANTPAIAAYSLALLGEHSGIDVFGMLTELRRTGHHPDNKKQFIQAINSIQPGLYKQLRQLAYTADDFSKGLAIVRDVVGKLD